MRHATWNKISLCKRAYLYDMRLLHAVAGKLKSSNFLATIACRNKPVYIVRFWRTSHGHMFLSHRVNAPWVDYGTLIVYWNKINSNILLSNSIKRLSLISRSAVDAKTVLFNLTINTIYMPELFFSSKNLREAALPAFPWAHATEKSIIWRDALLVLGFSPTSVSILCFVLLNTLSRSACC